ncbi:MAG: hypothetical protein ACI4GY_03920 [Acutalibacteraceae bacterium]
MKRIISAISTIILLLSMISMSVYAAQSAPGKVKNFTATALSICDVKLSWSKVSNITYYEIWRSTAKDSGYKKIKSVKGEADTTYTDKDLEIRAGSYYYKIRTLKTVGKSNQYSEFSKGISVNTTAFEKRTDNVGSMKVIDYKTVQFTWPKVNKTTYYDIYRGDKKIASVKGASNTTYTETNYPFEELYPSYSIRARKVIDGKSYAGTKCSLHSFNPTVISPKITSDYDKITLTWDKVKNVTGYEIYRADDCKDTRYLKFKKIGFVKGASNIKYVDKTVEPEKKYYYKVRIMKVLDGEKLYGAFKSELFPARAAKKVSGFYGVYENGKITLNWQKAEGVTYYEIFKENKRFDYSFINMFGVGDFPKNLEPYVIIKDASKTTFSEAYDPYLENGNKKNVWYCIRTCKVIDGKKYYSNASTAVGLGNDEQYALLSIKGSNVSGKKAKLTWNTKRSLKEDEFGDPFYYYYDVGGYEIFRSTSKNGTYSRIKTMSGAKQSASFTDTSLTKGKTYYYKIRTYHMSDNYSKTYSAFSPVISVKITK